MKQPKKSIRSIEFKIYPSKTQESTLISWIRSCCWIYNQSLEHRIKSYKRRRQNVTLYDQGKLLTEWRNKIDRIRLVPSQFGRGSLRRVDNGMKKFFKRVKSKDGKPGFPRFKSSSRFRSIEQIQKGLFIRKASIYIPGMGKVRARGNFDCNGNQKGIRIINKPSGWYAQILIEVDSDNRLEISEKEIGIDLGLESFATTDSGKRIENPRHLRRAEKKLRKLQQNLSRKQRKSRRRRKAVEKIAKSHENIVRKRKGFCHRISREIVNEFGLIAVENLNIEGLANGMLAKHVRDASWGKFIYYLTYKAECAGRLLVKVDPRGTSQECPACGRIARKELSEREHNCQCGLRCHRDHAAAQVIRQRAFRPVRGELLRPEATLASSMNRVNQATAKEQ